MDYSFIGSGKIYMREAGVAEALIEVGNASALSLAISEQSIKLADHTKPGGGTYNEVKRIESVEATMTLHDLSPANLSRALFGESDAVASATVTDEAITAYAGGLCPFAYTPDSTVDPVVASVNGDAAVTRANTTAYSLNAYIKPAVSNGFFYKVTTAGTSAGSPPTFPTTIGATVTDGTVTLTCWGALVPTKDTDYEVTAAGIKVLEDGRVTDGDGWTVDYTKANADVVQMLTNSGKTYELFFEGLNEARSDKPVIVDLYRVRLGAAQNLALIGDEHASLELTGTVLADTTKTGDGISKYGKISVVE